MSSPDSDHVKHFHDLLARFDTAMLVTHTAGGDLRARPMAIALVEENCRVWFFTSVSSGKVHEIETDTHVNVVCQKERDIYLSLSGTATLRRDRAKIDELWKEVYKVWFPNGKDDPELALVSVEPEEGEYWDQEGFKKIKNLFEAARAYATRTTPHTADAEQHAKVHLQST
jgi:general stress protein 26